MVLTCDSCNRVVEDDDDATLREICEFWHHIECEDLSKETYNSLRKQQESMHWYCGKYDATFVKISEVISRLESKQDIVES